MKQLSIFKNESIIRNPYKEKKDLEIFDTPKKLSEFQVRKLKKEVLHWYGEIEYFYEPLKKAPQKMQLVYVKELENENIW